MYTISFTLLIFVKLYIPKNIAKQTIGYTMQRFCCKNGVHVPVCLFIYYQFHSRGWESKTSFDFTDAIFIL